MKTPLALLLLLAATAMPLPGGAAANDATGDIFSEHQYRALNRRAASEYLRPVRRGGIDGRPYWNVFAKKFIYAPAFDFPATHGANKYRYELVCATGERRLQFEGRSPAESLAPVWEQVPVGRVELTVSALDRSGRVIATAGRRTFQRDFPFRGPYAPAPHGYRDAAVKAMLYVHNMPATRHWLTHTEPDMSFENNTYACKTIAATVSIECLLARHVPALRSEAIAIARSAAACLMRISQGPNEPLAYFPPTYYLEPENRNGWPHHTWTINRGKTMLPDACMPAQAFLDLYDLTADTLYLAQARRIAATYLRLQAGDGSWPIKVYLATGKPVEAVGATPSPMLFLLRRLSAPAYGHAPADYARAIAKAEKWMESGPLKTFNLTGQFEDQPMEGLAPYQNLTNCTANDYASYLLTLPAPTPAQVATATELMQLCEDQFVHWDVLPTDSAPDYANAAGATIRPELTPCVHEQYGYETPTDDSAAQVALGFLNLYHTTGQRLWLAKAIALTNAIAISQNQTNGQIPTTWEFRSEPFSVERTYWLNCTLNSVNQLLRMDQLINSKQKK